MAAPVLTGFAAELYQRLAPWAVEDPQRGWALAHLCAAIGAQWAEFDQVAIDTEDGRGWERVFDPDTSPAFALPWLAQFAGVRLTPGLTEAQWREEIKAMAGLRRCTPEAIRAIARVHLAGDAPKVTLFERSNPAVPGDQPYDLTVVTYTDETPDPAVVERALRRQKPIGVVLHYLVLDAWLVLHVEDTYDGLTVGDLEGDFATVYDFETNQP